MAELPPITSPRTIRPRVPAHDFRPIIALTTNAAYLERTGRGFAATELPRIIAAEPSSIIVCQGFGQHLQRLQRVFEDHPHFQYRLTPKSRTTHPADRSEAIDVRALDTVCNFVGFREVLPSGKIKSRYHYPLDPVHFVRTSIDELNESDDDRIVKLLTWAQEVREWCSEQRLQVKPSSGGLVAQLLRDPRFYPEPRRKVPRFINDTARTRLPGNYYHLRAQRDRNYQSVYLDQTNAHHFACRTIRFPAANELRAYGRYGRDADTDFGANADVEPSRRTRLYDGSQSPLLRHPGLFRLRLAIPAIPSTHFPPPWLTHMGVVDAWVYSNELELITTSGAAILGIVSAYVSTEVDHGLNRYGGFADEQLRAHSDWKPWLKPTLHSTYGILAARPTTFETGYYRANGGEPDEYVMGAASIPVRVHRTGREVESRIANVIQRGMIEAEVRKQSLWFARFLTEVDGRDVLCVYADSVFIRDDGRPMKLLPPPWRVSEYCTDLQFASATHFSSRELTRLPGLNKSLSVEARWNRVIAQDAASYVPPRPSEVIRSALQTQSPKGGNRGTTQNAGQARRGRYGTGEQRDRGTAPGVHRGPV